jgi:hypothetical protein
MYLPENADFCSHAVSFFGKLLDELAPLDCTDELFEQIVRKNEFVYGLLNVPRSTGSRCVDVGLSCGLFVAGLRFGAYGRQAIKDQSGTFSQAQQTECAHALRMLLYRRHAPLQKKKKNRITSLLPSRASRRTAARRSTTRSPRRMRRSS